MKELKRYWLSFILVAVAVLLWFWNPILGQDIFSRTIKNFREMLGILPPIFILLGLLEAWVPREIIIRYLGETSGIRGIFISIFLGAAAAGPLYAAFPVAIVMLRKGARYSNVVIFLCSWSTLKIPLILFEISALGWQLALTRAAVNIPGIIILGLLVDRLIPLAEKASIRERHLQEEMIPGPMVQR
jgi:uncharacterized membrane protein YraQ (UPF0718 family)